MRILMAAAICVLCSSMPTQVQAASYPFSGPFTPFTEATETNNKIITPKEKSF